MQVLTSAIWALESPHTWVFDPSQVIVAAFVVVPIALAICMLALHTLALMCAKASSRAGEVLPVKPDVPWRARSMTTFDRRPCSSRARRASALFQLRRHRRVLMPRSSQPRLRRR
jgi:hypothetical protein